MQKIAEQQPPKKALNIAQLLTQLGFNIHLLGSEKYVLKKLQELGDENIAMIREAFIKNIYSRFMKCFFFRTLFGEKQAYAEAVRKTNLKGLANLIKVCGVLLQTKVYLFWAETKIKESAL